MSETKTINLALDWTPNTIHTGLFIAVEKSYYQSQGITLNLLSPDATYSTTAAKRVQTGEAHLAICPSESCIAYQESGKMNLKAIYAILQKDASAIVTTKYSKLADLGDKKLVYGSYNARYEDDIIRSMITTDGGTGQGLQIEKSTGKFSLFDAVKEGKIDATWIFLPWEGVEASIDGVQLHEFRTEDYGVPYGYSPVIAYNASSSAGSFTGGGEITSQDLKKFVLATRKGYQYAMEHPDEAAEIMAKHCQPGRSLDFLKKSQNTINKFYCENTKSLGLMEDDKFGKWLRWLNEKGLTTTEKKVEAKDLYTNDFFVEN